MTDQFHATALKSGPYGTESIKILNRQNDMQQTTILFWEIQLHTDGIWGLFWPFNRGNKIEVLLWDQTPEYRRVRKKICIKFQIDHLIPTYTWVIEKAEIQTVTFTFFSLSNWKEAHLVLQMFTQSRALLSN